MSSESFFEVHDSLLISSATEEFQSVESNTCGRDNDDLWLLYDAEDITLKRDLSENEVDNSLSASIITIDSLSTKSGHDEPLLFSSRSESLISNNDLYENKSDISLSGSITTIDSLATKSECDQASFVSSCSESLTSNKHLYENEVDDSSSGSVTAIKNLSTTSQVCNTENNQPSLISRDSELPTSNKHLCENRIDNSSSGSITAIDSSSTKGELCNSEDNRPSFIPSDSESPTLNKQLCENRIDNSPSGSITVVDSSSTKGELCNSEDNRPSLIPSGSELRTLNKHLCEHKIDNSSSESISTIDALPTKSEVCCNENDKFLPLSKTAESQILNRLLSEKEVNNSSADSPTDDSTLPFENHVSDSAVNSTSSLSTSVTTLSLSFEKHTCDILWKINDFHSNITANGQDYVSPSFTPSKKPNYRWFVGLRTTGKADDDCIEIFIKPGFLCGTGCHITYTLSVQNANHSRIAEWKVETSITSELESTKHHIKRSYVQNVLVSDVLFIHVDITFEILPELDKEESFGRCITMGYSHVFPGDLLSMLGNESFCDASISVDDAGTLYTIPVHRLLLAARSSFFHAKLTQDTPERKERCIKLMNIDIATVLNMLTFIYADKIDNSLSTKQIILLLKCSMDYSITGLKILCETQLIRRVNNSSVFDCLAAACVYNATELKTKCMEIICQSKRNILRLKCELKSSLVEMTQEQRLTLLTEIMMQILSKKFS